MSSGAVRVAQIQRSESIDSPRLWRDIVNRAQEQRRKLGEFKRLRNDTRVGTTPDHSARRGGTSSKEDDHPGNGDDGVKMDGVSPEENGGSNDKRNCDYGAGGDFNDSGGEVACRSTEYLRRSKRRRFSRRS